MSEPEKRSLTFTNFNRLWQFTTPTARLNLRRLCPFFIITITEEPQVATVATGHYYLALSFPLRGFPNVACFRIFLQELADSVQMITQTDSSSIVAFVGV